MTGYVGPVRTKRQQGIHQRKEGSGFARAFAVEDDCLLLRRQVDIVDDTVDVVVERVYQRVFSA